VSTHDSAKLRRARRRARYRQLRALRRHSMRGGARDCMMPVVGGMVDVSYHASGATTISGTKRCKSAAACPICAENIRQRRSTEIDAIIAGAQAEGCTVLFVTATSKHRADDDLRQLQKAMQAAWSACWSGAAPKRHGYIGQARAWDYTYGSAGWHPHIHAVLIFDAHVPPAVARSFVEDRFLVYRAHLRKNGRDARRALGTESVGWDVQSVDDDGQVLADYMTGVTKLWSAGAEVALSTQKRSSVSPWAILDAAVDGVSMRNTILHGWSPERLWCLWREYEAGTKGTQQIVVGAALHRWAEVVDDEEAAQGSDETDVLYVETFTASEWAFYVELGRIPDILEHVENVGSSLVRSGP
jgi:hypothetical protein